MFRLSGTRSSASYNRATPGPNYAKDEPRWGEEVARKMFDQTNCLHLILIDSERRVTEFFINRSGPRRPPRKLRIKNPASSGNPGQLKRVRRRRKGSGACREART